MSQSLTPCKRIARCTIAVGHRVMHGGTRFEGLVLATSAVLFELDKLKPLAPLHQVNDLGPIRIFAERDPSVPQVAYFDTAFHATQAKVERFRTKAFLHAFVQMKKRVGLFANLSFEKPNAWRFDIRQKIQNIGTSLRERGE
jgi:hypothetical protein